MRCGVHELPPDPDVAAPSGATTCRPWGVALPGSEADELASTGDDPGSMSSRAVFRLRRALPPVRDGLRPSRSQHEAGCRHQDDRTSWYAAPTGRDREVRYRLCELSSPSNTEDVRQRRRGSSSVGGAAAFQAACRGFESRLPLQSPLTLTSRRPVRALSSRPASWAHPDHARLSAHGHRPPR